MCGSHWLCGLRRILDMGPQELDHQIAHQHCGLGAVEIGHGLDCPALCFGQREVDAVAANVAGVCVHGLGPFDCDGDAGVSRRTGWPGVIGGDQLGPDVAPVAGEQIAAGDLAASEGFNGHRRFDRGRLGAHDPATDAGRRYAHMRGQCDLPAAFLLSPFFEIHGVIISHGVSDCQ